LPASKPQKSSEEDKLYRKTLATKRAVVKRKIQWLKDRCVAVLQKAGVPPALAAAGVVNRVLPPAVTKELETLKAEQLEKEMWWQATLKETRRMPADQEEVDAQIKAWAIQRKIPLRELGWGVNKPVLQSGTRG
jgi:hypothetical protein